MTASAFAPDLSRRQARAFRAARRHSIAVRVLRFAFPATAFALAAVFLAIVLLPRAGSFGPVTFDAVRVTDGALVMENPRLSGIDRNERAYNLSAEAASQQIGRTDIVDLEKIDATLAVDPTQDARIQAGSGRFDQEAETLVLKDGVNVATSTGYKVSVADASVDLNAGTVESGEPITVEMLNGTLNAAGVSITERGEIVRFTGPVRMIMQMHGRDEGR